MTFREAEDWDAEDRAFQFFGETMDVERTKELWLSDPVANSGLSALTFTRAAYCVGGDHAGLIEELQREVSPLGRSVILFGWIFQAQQECPSDALVKVEEAVRAIHDGDPPTLDLSAIAVARAFRLIEEDCLGLAHDLLVEHLGRVRESERWDSPKNRIVECAARLALSQYYRRRCELPLSDGFLEQASRICRRGNLMQQLTVTQLRATVKWLLGDFAGGLRLHQMPAARQCAKDFGFQYWLLASYLSAAKNAIDAQRQQVAEQELLLADRCLARQGGAAAGNLQFYYSQFLGELRFYRGQLEEAHVLLQEAYEGFDSTEYVWGQLDNQITVAHLRFLASNRAVGVSEIQSLRERVNDHGSSELRARVFHLSTAALLENPTHAAFAEIKGEADMAFAAAPAVFLDGLANLHRFSIRERDSFDTEVFEMIEDLESRVDDRYYARVRQELASIS